MIVKKIRKSRSEDAIKKKRMARYKSDDEDPIRLDMIQLQEKNQGSG